VAETRFEGDARYGVFHGSGATPRDFLPDVCFISSRVHVASHACSQIRDHVRAFLLGSTTALSIGYYKVHQSLWESTASVSGHLEKLGEETTHSQTVLQQRVALLEAEVAKLKEKLDAQ
jgi:uncharacterized small protein (DUF1192 family)